MQILPQQVTNFGLFAGTARDGYCNFVYFVLACFRARRICVRYLPVPNQRANVHLSCRVGFSGVIQGVGRIVPAWEIAHWGGEATQRLLRFLLSSCDLLTQLEVSVHGGF
jgi:hypothetical protein